MAARINGKTKGMRFVIYIGVCRENSVGLKWHLCDTSFGIKASIWWVLMQKQKKMRRPEAKFVFVWSAWCVRGL